MEYLEFILSNQIKLDLEKKCLEARVILCTVKQSNVTKLQIKIRLSI